MSIDEALNLFLKDGILAGKSEATQQNYKDTINLFMRVTASLTGIRPLEAIDKTNIQEYLMYGMTQRGWNRYTAWSVHKNLKAFFNWCVLNKHIEFNPVSQVPKPKIPQQYPKALSEQEVIELLQTMDKIPCNFEYTKIRNKMLIATLIFTGLRKSELLSLKFRDVDMTSNFIYIENGKGGKSREVPIELGVLRPILADYISQRSKYYNNDDWFVKGTPSSETTLCEGKLSERAFRRIFEAINKLLNTRIYAHKLRHTFATLLLEKTGDIYVLQQLLGHSNIKTTCIYLSTTRNKKIEAISKFKLV